MDTNYSCRVYLQHEFAQAFFDEALHPNIEALGLRDQFLAEAAESCPYSHDGNDLVAEIPDIDLDALCCANDRYQEVKYSDFVMKPAFMEEGAQTLPYKMTRVLNLAA